MLEEALEFRMISEAALTESPDRVDLGSEDEAGEPGVGLGEEQEGLGPGMKGRNRVGGDLGGLAHHAAHHAGPFCGHGDAQGDDTPALALLAEHEVRSGPALSRPLRHLAQIERGFGLL